MSYQYDATLEERAAERLLREKGWAVTAPTCPDCHGSGFVGESTVWGDDRFGGGSYSTKPCPRGCPQAALFLSQRSYDALLSVRASR